MARKKSKQLLNEEAVKALYTSKKYTPPEEKELESIREDSKEENDIESHLSPSSTCIEPHTVEKNPINEVK